MHQPNLLHEAAAQVADVVDAFRSSAVARFMEIGGTAALAAVALAGCADDTTYYQTKGVVELGANGHKYIIPDGAERPIYKTDAACVEDVKRELKEVEKQDSVTLHDTPSALCQPVSKYPDNAGNNQDFPFIYYYYFYGPIVSPGSMWQSNQVVTWQSNIPSGTFAAEGTTVPGDLESAPENDAVGESVTEDEDGENLGDSPESYSDGSSNEAADDSGDSSGDDAGDDDVDSFGGDGDSMRNLVKVPSSPFSRLILSWDMQPTAKHHGVVRVRHHHQHHTS
jgi:hypothetical protein